MTLTDASAAGADGLGIAIEYDPATGTGTPGVPVSPTSFAPTTNIGLNAKWNMIEPEVERGTLMTHAIMVNDRVDPLGQIDYWLNPALLTEAFQLTLGAKVALTAVTGVTTAINVTAVGVTILTITGTFAPGAMVDIGTGSNLVRTVVLPTSISGSLKVPALPGALATAASGLSVSQVAQNKAANSLLPTGKLAQLPCATFEHIINNGVWSIQYPWMYSEGLSLDYAEKGIMAKLDLVGSSAPNFGSAAGTSPATFVSAAYAPNAALEAIALNPFTSINCTMVALGDPDATGASTVVAASNLTDMKLDFKNSLEKVAVMNRGTSYTYFPSGKAALTVSYNEIATSKRWDIYNDAIAANVGAPLIAGTWKNFGTLSAPVYKGVSAYVPYMKFDDQKLDAKVGAVNRFSNTGKALAQAGGAQDYLQLFWAA